MSVAFDAESAALRFKDAETEELVRIVFVDHQTYLADAVALARSELNRRGIEEQSDPAAVVALSNVYSEIAAREDVANLPANPIWLVVCFILADIVAIVTALIYSVNGRKRAAMQTWKALGYGWLARIVLVIVFMIPWGT